MKPSKRELWREVEQLDEEVPPARNHDDADEWTEEMLARIFEDEESEEAEEFVELQEQVDELYGDGTDAVDPETGRR